MARCERYTGDTERFTENSRASEGVVLRKTKPAITEASALFLHLVLPSSVSLPTIGLAASARDSPQNPASPPVRSVAVSGITTPGAETPLSDDVGGVAVACSWISQLQLQDSLRTNLNKSPPVVLRCRITWSFKSLVTITVSQASRWYVSTEIPFRDFPENTGPFFIPVVSSNRIFSNISAFRTRNAKWRIFRQIFETI